MNYRSQIKTFAKQRLSSQYGTTLGACILAALPQFALTFIYLILLFVFILVAAFSEPAAIIMLFVMVFAYPIVTVGSYLLMPFSAIGVPAFMLSAVRGVREKAIYPYTSCKNYGKKLGGLLWMMLFIHLWSLPFQVTYFISVFSLGISNIVFTIGIIISILLLIPFIVKSLSYSFHPYILNDCPNLTVRQALNLSKKMTQGIKGELFVFDLSFIGWWLLTALTCSILAIYTVPYYQMAKAALYESMKTAALASGKISQADLDPTLVCGYENNSEN